MMGNTFQELVRRLIQERGVEVLETPGACKALLQDYAKGRFKREIRLFLQSIGAGHHRKLLKSEDPERMRHMVIRSLQDEYGIDREIAEETVAILAECLKPPRNTEDQGIAHLRRQAEAGRYRAQYALGAALYTLKQYQEAADWFEQAARRCMALCETGSPAGGDFQPFREDVFVEIRGGTGRIGSPETEPGRSADEIPHEIAVPGFFMAAYPVTQTAYTAVTGRNPSAFKGGDLPAERVSWFDAVAYCNARSLAEGLAPAYRIQEEEVVWNREAPGYRLPTEAEWEYACRAGTATAFSLGETITYKEANYDGYRRRTTAAGSFPPNPWGLYDMHGNIAEWCWDWYWAYDLRGRDNPAGAAWGTNRVIRGGSWKDSAGSLRSASRGSRLPTARSEGIGFRLLCSSAVCTVGRNR